MGCRGCIKGAVGLSKAALRIDRADEATINARRDACRDCKHATRNADRLNRVSKGLTSLSRCQLCSCFIAAKTAIASERCPEGKW